MRVQAVGVFTLHLGSVGGKGKKGLTTFPALWPTRSLSLSVTEMTDAFKPPLVMLGNHDLVIRVNFTDPPESLKIPSLYCKVMQPIDDSEPRTTCQFDSFGLFCLYRPRRIVPLCHQRLDSHAFGPPRTARLSAN